MVCQMTLTDKNYYIDSRSVGIVTEVSDTFAVNKNQ